MEHKCLHETEWGKVTNKLGNMQHQINKVENDVKDLKSHNVTIAELSIHLKNLVTEVRELCVLVKEYGCTIDSLERAHGDELLEMKKNMQRSVQAEVVRTVSRAIVALGAALLAGKFII